MILNDIAFTLKKAESVAILPHVSADGDALGSSIALGYALKRLNKAVVIYLEEDVPYNYAFLPGTELVSIHTKSEGLSSSGSGETSSQFGNHDVVVALDTGDLNRLGSRIEIFNRGDTTINIDHHQTNTRFADYNHVDVTASAVGEIVYRLIKMLGLDMDTVIAACLYVAVVTDTGGFRYSNTTSVTHQIAAELINEGIDVADISQKVFDSTPVSKVKLMGEAINSLELLENGLVSLIAVTDEMLRKAGAREEDSEGLVNIGRNIEGVEVSLLLRQRSDGFIKANLRSKSTVDVSAIASFFNGGGHKRAAGFSIQGDLKDIREKLLTKVREVMS